MNRGVGASLGALEGLQLPALEVRAIGQQLNAE